VSLSFLFYLIYFFNISEFDFVNEASPILDPSTIKDFFPTGKFLTNKEKTNDTNKQTNTHRFKPRKCC
jgi:hypothetical protein